MLAENVPAEWFYLAVETEREPCPFKTEVQPSDAGEERCDGVAQLDSPLERTTIGYIFSHYTVGSSTTKRWGSPLAGLAASRPAGKDRRGFAG